MHNYRHAFCSGLLCLLLAAPAFGQTTTGTETRPAPSKQPSDNPTTPDGTTRPHNDPRRQREESIEADRTRKSGEMGYRRDSSAESRRRVAQPSNSRTRRTRSSRGPASNSPTREPRRRSRATSDSAPVCRPGHAGDRVSAMA